MESELNKMKKRPWVVFIAPHKCPSGVRDPGCDKRSGLFATWLAENMDPAVVSKVFINRRPRWIRDPNRAAGRYSRIRCLLRELMEFKAPPGSIIVEVHSFPPNSFRGADTVILSQPFRSPGEFQDLLATHTGTMALPGGATNDIGFEATMRGWPHVLLEVREDLALEKLSPIARFIAQFVQR